MVKQYKKFDKQNGSALILVVVVTVLLAVVGVMFLMVSRASELETHAVIQNKDLNNAVDTVVARINEVLVEDLFANGDLVLSPHDATTDDAWLCDLEPDFGADLRWSQITDLWSLLPTTTLILDDGTGNPDLWMPNNPLETLLYDQADADGDGVADSRWVPMPALTSSRGEAVFAAVRITDNCAMLNLNAAHCFYQGDTAVSPFAQPWFENDTTVNEYHNNESGTGRYLTEINYLPFLRGSDLNGGSANWYNIQTAKGFGDIISPISPQVTHNALMNLENPATGIQFFNIGDELELRNRYLLTSNVESRFEQEAIAHFSFDADNGPYAALEIPRDNSGGYPIGAWNIRIDPSNFDQWDEMGSVPTVPMPDPYEYDRRHVCTVFSYDRMFRRGQYPLLDAEFDVLAIAAGWTQQQREQARKLFWPVGPVTTNIAVPIYNPISGQDENNWNNTETRRRILHLLFAFREYFRGSSSEAAKRAAQVVANIIDYSDDDAPNNGIPGESEGPFYDPRYEQQANVDNTFLTEQIIQDMMFEVSGEILGPRNSFSIPFGLDADPADSTDDIIVFGYEKQPFISEVYVRWDGGAEPPNPHLIGFAIELINPYDTPISILDWKLKIGSAIDHTFVAGTGRPSINDTSVPEYSEAAGLGRLVIQVNSTGTVPADANSYNITGIDWVALENAIKTQSAVLLKPVSSSSTTFLSVDSVSTTDLQKIEGISGILGGPGNNALKRDDNDWRFVQAEYDIQTEGGRYNDFTDTLGQSNNLPAGTINVEGFQIAVADNGQPLTRWHELEVLGLYGNKPESNDPNVPFDPEDVITYQWADASLKHFDLTEPSNNPLDYIATINRPDFGSLPGRININTAPAHVIAAAIPPTLADPNAAIPGEVVTFSSLQLADAIVDNRPYQNLSELLTKVPEMKQYDDSGAGAGAWVDENVGAQSIEDDIEEEHWILSNLANKFTVRSDTFTAYILVRLGEEGPQRRMIGIFDRSQVWTENDRPKLVALHPVPDPR